MASFYDSASIIIIPSGYKAGTLYSAKPTDGTGDMTFTRTGDTATRVNSAGIIERCITNLALQSNGFDTASWTKNNTTIGTGIADPNGGTTAFSLAGSSATLNGKNISQVVFTSASDIKTISIYAKANTHSFIQIRLTTSSIYVNFDLTNGTFSAGAGAAGTMTSIGGGWYRCQMSGGGTNISGSIQLVDSLSAVFNESSTTTNSVYIWRAQAQTGDFATNYIPTTTAAVTQGPVTNLPRLDYFGSTCPQLLMEPTRTNLFTFSDMFDNSAWAKDAASVSGNVLVSPDGYTNADLLVEDSSLGNHRVFRSFSYVSGTTYAASCFIKQGSGTRRIIFFYGATAFGSNLMVNFNIQTGVVTTSSGSITGKLENYGNGWYRCTAIATATTTASTAFGIYLRQTDAATSATYTGDGTSSMYLWGAQIEAGAYATSYIPTTAATVTRNLDSAFDTGISSLLGQTEGTVFIDMSHSANISARSIFAIDINATTNFIAGTINNSNAVVFQVRQSGSSTTIITSSALSLGRHKIAFAYKSGDYALYIDGVQIGTSNSTVYPVGTLDQLVFSSANYGQLGDKFNQNIVFKTRLSNADLATLTTL
jgi:hypothetical protein